MRGRFRPIGLPLSLRLALREIRGGLGGFRLFLACLALGVGAIAVVGSLSSSLVAGRVRDARAQLGGDIEIVWRQRQPSPEERAWLERQGRLSAVVAFDAMAASPRGERTLVEIKAVDRAYPLIGTVDFDPPMALTSALAFEDDAWGIAVPVELMSRLALTPGDVIRTGDVGYRLRAVIRREPDPWFSIWAPHVLVAKESLAATGLLRPGSKVVHIYRLALPGGVAAAGIKAAFEAGFPTSASRLQSYDDVAAEARGFIEQSGQYLTLVGLATLLLGGIGAGNAVRFHLRSKRATIATLKSLGATAGQVFRSFLALVLSMTVGGIALGMAFGAVAPFAANHLLADMPALRLEPVVDWRSLALAGASGLLATLAVTLGPLADAAAVKPADLFRANVVPAGVGRRPLALVASAMAMSGLVALVVWQSADRVLAIQVIAGVLAAALALKLTVWVLITGIRRLRPVRRPLLRLALANLHRPGAPTAAVVLSLGLGLTVLVAVALVEANLSRQIGDGLSGRSPTFYVVDLQSGDVAGFDRLAGETEGVSLLQRTPFVRGRLQRIDGVPVDRSDDRCASLNDRPLGSSATPPFGARFAEGAWWSEGAQEIPLVSVADNIAEACGMRMGGTLTFLVLGRPVEARIANIRRIGVLGSWTEFSFILSPGTLDAFPTTHIAFVHADGVAAETRLLVALGEHFPAAAVIRVRDVLTAMREILDSILAGIRMVAAVTLLAGMLVLAGAVAAGQQARIRDAVVLKILGARRRDVMAALMLEYGGLGLIAGAAAALLGVAAGYLVLTYVIGGDFVFDAGAVISATLLALAITLALGVALTWRALGRTSAAMLRSE